VKRKSTFKKKTVKRLARLAKVPPTRVMNSKKEKLERRRRVDWGEELNEAQPQNQSREKDRGG